MGSILYTTCIDQTADMQHDQELYCHTKCLLDLLHFSAKLYAVDLMDFSVEESSGESSPEGRNNVS